MKPIIRALLILLPAIALATAPSIADSPSIFGTIFHCPDGKCTARSGDRTLLNSDTATDHRWFGPSFTDDRGVFAFYDLPEGPYVLHVYDANGQEVWRQSVQSPRHIDPIQLRTQ